MSSKNNRGRNLPEGWTSNISKKSRPGHRYYTHKNGRKQWGSPVNNIKNRVGGDESIHIQDPFKARDAAAQLYYAAEAKVKALQVEGVDLYHRIVWDNTSEEMEKIKKKYRELLLREKEADIEMLAAQERFKNASQEADKNGKYPPYAGRAACAAYVAAAGEEAAQKAVREIQNEAAKHPPCVGNPTRCAKYHEADAVKQLVEAHRAHEEAAQKAARECEETEQRQRQATEEAEAGGAALQRAVRAKQAEARAAAALKAELERQRQAAGNELCVGCTPGSKPQSMVEQARAALKAELERRRQAEELERQRQSTGNHPCVGCTDDSIPYSSAERAARQAAAAELERRRQAAEAAGSNTTKKTESGGRRRKTKKNLQRRR